MQQGSFTAGIGGGLWSRRHRRSGFARFSMTRFSLDKNQLENQAIHLTNVAVQKKQDNYDAESGGKWDLKPLKMSDPQLPVLFHGEPPWNNKALSPFATVVSRSVQCEECAHSDRSAIEAATSRCAKWFGRYFYLSCDERRKQRRNVAKENKSSP